MIVYPLIAYEHFENLLIHKETLMKCRALCVLCAIGMVVDRDVLVMFVEPGVHPVSGISQCISRFDMLYTDLFNLGPNKFQFHFRPDHKICETYGLTSVAIEN